MIQVTETGEILVDGKRKTDEEVQQIIENLNRARVTAREVSKLYRTIETVLKKHADGGLNEN